MNLSIVSLAVRGKRDIIVARQRARQIAGLLGYDLHEQTAIAARVFEIACHAWQSLGQAIIHFQLQANRLQIVVEGIPARHSREAALSGGKDEGCGGAEDKQLDHRGARRLIKLLCIETASAPRPPLRLDKPLPEKAPDIAWEDLQWMVQELAHRTPLNLFEEIQLQNQALLRAMQELEDRQMELIKLNSKTIKTAAA